MNINKTYEKTRSLYKTLVTQHNGQKYNEHSEFNEKNEFTNKTISKTINH